MPTLFNLSSSYYTKLDELTLLPNLPKLPFNNPNTSAINFAFALFPVAKSSTFVTSEAISTLPQWELWKMPKAT
jgi:Leucine-rich repeat (LRR) protein